MSRAQWFFILALAAASAVVYWRRPKTVSMTLTESYNLNEDAGKVEHLPPDSQVHGASSAGALQTTQKKTKKAVPPPKQP